ncbi:ADP-ribosylglycohydrolase family protein [Streptomyces tsukubensis]|uniref:ADP-ribosylglycohydrolase n=1 Tax=Streptomyces tsukubensis TaxID=83656 RepID=A0A1V4A1M9_9ACTN|nr:ADP-ribosylglycohydrolase family protein [Streptomyces tsukubensis]OON72222.1 ADP-ribosylglycohydrolase [Streptomyces tsukubensis]QFR94117.1 ADP-ribosylglycohydrolase family protein [Streptomyces tsukubensis]
MSAPASASTATVWGRAEQQDFRSRVRGTLLGTAVGDALGAPAAPLTIEAIRSAYGAEGITDLVPAHGRRGAVTAATQLSLFTVDGLIRAQVRRDTGAWHPPTDVHRAYRRWVATQNDWGPDERRAGDGWLAREEWLYVRRDAPRDCLLGLGDDAMGTLDAPKNPRARGTEAATRSAPFGLLVGWEPGLVLQLAVECAVQTHGHPAGFLAAGAHAVIVHGLARGGGPDTAVAGALALLAQREGHEPVTAALQGALAAVRDGTPPGDRIAELASDGAAENTLAAAVYAALVCADVRQGLRLAVNHSGASAAAGALCGALLGAMHGDTALPPGWLAELEGRSTILELADDFAMEMTQGPALHTPTAAAPGWLARYPRAV